MNPTENGQPIEDRAEAHNEKEEPGQLWREKINGNEVIISRGWQREVYVKINNPFPWVARIEYANPLRRTTRFFRSCFLHAFR